MFWGLPGRPGSARNLEQKQMTINFVMLTGRSREASRRPPGTWRAARQLDFLRPNVWERSHPQFAPNQAY
eukprot:8208874-Pyramimonas_sp.AAC.1